jgi:hypothetical protein
MNAGKVFVIELVFFILLAGGLAYWVYERHDFIDGLSKEIASRQQTYNIYDSKVSKIVALEGKKSKLEVNRNKIDVAVPEEGSQRSIDIMSIIDDIKQNVETVGEDDIPLLIIKQGQIKGLRDDGIKKKVVRGAAKKEYKTITIKLAIYSTWLGKLRFIDLLEKDDQIFNVILMKGQASKKEFPNEVTTNRSEIIKDPPFKYSNYTKTDLIIETYHLLKTGKKK